MTYNKGIQDVPIKICAQIANFISIINSRGKKTDFNDIHSHFKLTKSYIQNAINILHLSEIVTLENGNYLIDKRFVTHLKDIKDEDVEPLILQQLVKIDPFVQYCTFLSREKTSIESAQLVCKIFDIDKNASSLHKIFDKWIKWGNITVKKDRFKKFKILLEPIKQDELEARVFINDILGESYKEINKASIEDFVESIIEYKDDPKKSINDCGRGLEDFLRLDFGVGVDLTKNNGVGQISTTLLGKGLINAKQNHLLMALASVRTMGDAHGVDKTSTERWSIKPESALATIVLTLSTIHSLISFKKNQSLVI